MKELYCFDLDGTFISSYMDTPNKDYDDWHVLPGRKAAIHSLLEQGCRIAFITNQAGVAFGYQTERQFLQKMIDVLNALDLPDWDNALQHDSDEYAILGYRNPVSCLLRTSRHSLTMLSAHYYSTLITVHVCFAHRDGKPGYNDRLEVRRRKPSPAMLYEARSIHNTLTPNMIMVGDMDTDEQAAKAAGVDYVDAEDFFAWGEAEEDGQEE